LREACFGQRSEKDELIAYKSLRVCSSEALDDISGLERRVGRRLELVLAAIDLAAFFADDERSDWFGGGRRGGREGRDEHKRAHQKIPRKKMPNSNLS
jgi:hypothetical protein